MPHQLSKTTFPAFTALVLVLAACGSHDGDDSNQAIAAGGGTASPSAGSSSLPSFAGSAPIGGSTSQPASGGSGSTMGASGAPSNPGSTSDGLSCDVRTILKKSCSTCHGATAQFGAPFSLTTAAQLREHGAKILQRIADDQRPMPPEPNPRLTSEERATLSQYINAGAPSSSCADTSTPVTNPVDMPTTPTDPNVTCYKIVARASAANDKYTVPTTPDLYECFNYAPPWGNKKVQLVSTRPIVDNAKVLHHWLLYNSDASVTDGSHSDCIGAHPNSSLVAGWAPGGQPFTAPADVGVQVASGGFTLETHFNNKEGEGQLDASGVEVCVTDKMRPKEAAMHWLGTQNLNKQMASGTCYPTNTGDVTILQSTPHMHLQGRHMTTVINRAGGGTEMLLDKPFDFQTQVSYATPAVVHKGDTLTTTCTFATPTRFGESTNDEMCYNFVLAYPAGALAQGIQILRKYDCTGF